MSIIQTGIGGFDRGVAAAEALRQASVLAAAGNQVLAAQADIVFHLTVVSLGQQFNVSVGAANDALLQLQGLPPPLQN